MIVNFTVAFISPIAWTMGNRSTFSVGRDRIISVTIARRFYAMLQVEVACKACPAAYAADPISARRT
ncbi:MAG TPA: hypothetical protein VKP67_01420 [Xanthobacteraceae bacterium]|nr:hypothetical protein [Xanthobacteraceae bacterium]